MRSMNWRTAIAAVLLLSGACSSNGGGGGGGDGGNPADLAGNGSADMATSGSTDMAGYIPGTVSGMINSMSFATPMTSLFFEALDASNGVNTTVVYLFSGSIQCADIQAAGWDTRIPAGTQILELKMWGTTPAMDYTVTTSMTPGAGEAAVSYSVAAATTNDFVGSGGKVRLETRQANTRVTGSFLVTWTNGSLNGTYNAKFCSGGTEP